MADSMASAPELQKNTRLMLSAGSAHQLLGQQPGQERAVHLHHVRQVEVDRLVEGGLERGVAPSEGVDAESGEEIEIAFTLGVEEVRPFAPDVEVIEADRLEYPRQLVVQVLVVQFVVFAMTRP